MVSLLSGSGNERSSVVGHPLGVEPGDTIECFGCWSRHPKWGKQFKAKEIRTVSPTDASGAIAWMMSRLPQVGRKNATAMVERWGLPRLWEVLSEGPGALTELPGITPRRAAAIAEAYAAFSGEREQIVELRRIGLSDRQAARVVDKWGATALEKIRENPYSLAQHVDGFGFVRSDAVAKKMGLPVDHPDRLRAGLLHTMQEATHGGHTAVGQAKLVAIAAGVGVLGVPERIVWPALGALLEDGALLLWGRRRDVHVRSIAAAESSLASGVKRLLGRRMEAA